MEQIDVIIIGAGAAGLMCAIECGKRGKKVLVLDHANKVGKKILMSGGGRCNFTNYYIEAEKYSSHNVHFVKSALSRYTQWDFIKLVNKYHIPFHEKTLGQLFCTNKAQDIVTMLLREISLVQAKIVLNTKIDCVQQLKDHSFKLSTSNGHFLCHSLVIATGGLSIPTMGASPFAYKIAEQFAIKVWPTRAGLVPLTLNEQDKVRFSTLSGVSLDALVSNNKIEFRENLLFTHRGLSGPAMLQISSYWHTNESLTINLLPSINLKHILQQAKGNTPNKQLNTILNNYLSKSIIEVFVPGHLYNKKIADFTHAELQFILQLFEQWAVKPHGTEGYRTAEVTIGGVDCHAISSKTMETNRIKNLYFIGEALDVHGWLGGYNFQWAWSSGWAAGQVA